MNNNKRCSSELKYIADETQIYKMHINEMINSMRAIKNIDQNLKNIYNNKILDSTQVSKKLAIAFDIDETLVHLPKNPHENIGRTILKFKLPNGEFKEAGIHIRPHSKLVLEQLNQIVDLYLFTAGNEEYAGVISQFFDPKNELFKKVLSRNHCIFDKSLNIYIKDLRILGRDMNYTFLVDNSAISFAFNIENGIPALPFYDDDNDEFLLRLYDYIKKLNQSDNPLQVNEREFKLKEITTSSIIDYLHFYNASSPYHSEIIHQELNDFSHSNFSYENLKENSLFNQLDKYKNSSNKVSIILKPSEVKLSEKTKGELTEILNYWKKNKAQAGLYGTPIIKSKKESSL